MKKMIFLASALLISPAFGQTMYKCPPKIPGGTPVFQQMPCSPTGGGESMQVRALPGSGEGLRESERETLESLTKERKELEKARDAENSSRITAVRQAEAAEIERRKAEAMEAQAAAQAATARALRRRR